MKGAGTTVLMCAALVVAVVVGIRGWAGRRPAVVAAPVPAAAPAPLPPPRWSPTPPRVPRFLPPLPAPPAPPPPAPLPLPAAPPPWAAPAPWQPGVTPAAPGAADGRSPLPRASTPWAPREVLADSLEAALQADLRPFQEAHWNGLEVIPATPALLESLGMPADSRGVIVDDVTLPADLEGFQAGDLVTVINRIPTPDLLSFMDAADRMGERRRTEVELVRAGRPLALVITARGRRLGTANGETAPMIRPGSRPPHDYLGPCTDCHRIGTNGQLGRDPGDSLARGAAPTIHPGMTRPHRDRGECTTCHTIVP